MSQILQNEIKCLKCGDEIFSAHVHDFKYCKCGAVAVDGGMHYLRRVGELTSIQDMSVSVTDKTYEELLEAIKWAKDTNRNDLGLICAFFRVLRANGYDLSIEED